MSDDKVDEKPSNDDPRRPTWIPDGEYDCAAAILVSHFGILFIRMGVKMHNMQSILYDDKTKASL